MSDPDFQFPLIQLRDDANDIETFKKDLVGDSGGDIEPGAILIDSSGRAWDVHGRTRPLEEHSGWRRLFIRYLGWPQVVEPHFVERPAMSWSETLDRVCAIIDRPPYDWADDEISAGEAGDPIEPKVQIEMLTGWIRQSANLGQLVQLLYWTNFDECQALVDSWREGGAAK